MSETETVVEKNDEIVIQPEATEKTPPADPAKVVKKPTRSRKKKRGRPSKRSTSRRAKTGEKKAPVKPKTDLENELDEYADKLDGDTKDKKADLTSGEGDTVKEPSDPGAGDPVKKPVPGKALMSMTKIVAPILTMVLVRLLTWGKKKPKLVECHFDEDDIEALEDLADDAADEILGNISPGWLFIITGSALVAANIMDKVDFIAVFDKKKTADDNTEDQTDKNVVIPDRDDRRE